MSTQEQVALARMGKALMLGKGSKTIAGRWVDANGNTEVANVPLTGRYLDNASGLRFEPTSAPPYYVSYEVAGIPRDAPPPDATVFDIKRTYHTPDGKPWSGGKLAEGDSLIVELTIQVDEQAPDALVTDLLPAGLEIENFNLGDAKQWAGVVIDGIELANRDRASEEFGAQRRDTSRDISRDIDARSRVSV